MVFFMLKLIFVTFNFIIISSLSHADTKFPFYLNVVGEDKSLNKIVRVETKKLVSNFSNLTLREDKDGRVFVKLFIYALRHKNSKISKDTIILSSTHINRRRIVELTKEVFKKDSKSSKLTKTIAADLMLKDSGLMRHINIAAMDDIDKIGVPILRFSKDLSANIENYYEASFFDMLNKLLNFFVA